MAVPCLLNEVIGGVEVGRDVLCVYVSHCHLQLLEALGHLQILWVVVDADQPARIKHLPAAETSSMSGGHYFQVLLARHA